MIRIENTHPTLGPRGFIFNAENGVKVSKFDVGSPAIRDVIDDIPQADGTQDYTTYLGNRVVTLEFMIYPGWAESPVARREIIDTLTGLCTNPRIRPFLYESVDGQAERRIMLRPDQLTTPFVAPHYNQAQLSMVAPYGLWESGQLQLTEIGPGSGGSPTTGRSYNLTFDRTYVSRPPAGGKVVVNEGNFETYPAMIIYGPCDDVIISNETTGVEMVFPALALTAGQSVVIDHRLRRIYPGGSPDLSLYNEVDWTISQWMTLVPGENQMGFNPTGYSEATKLSIAYRHNWI